MSKFLRYTSILILIFVSISSHAQQNCAFKLQEAEQAYASGVLDSIPALLRDCINNDGFDKEELASAYKLLIKKYLFEDFQEMAELTMLKFRKEFPEYEIKPTDPVEFTYLYKSYQTVPVFSVGVIIGGNYSMVRIMQAYSNGNAEDYNGEYTSAINFQGGLQFKKYINQNYEINLDIIYTSKGFNYKIKQNQFTTDYKETQSMISFPLTGTYDFNLGKWSPYVRLGVNVDYLLNAKADFVLSNGQSELENEKGVDIKAERNNYFISAIIGGGLKLNIKRGYFMLDARYQMGFSNNTNPDTRFETDYKWSQFFYTDDDFTINNLSVSIGFVYPFYRTKRK